MCLIFGMYVYSVLSAYTMGDHRSVLECIWVTTGGGGGGGRESVYNG